MPLNLVERRKMPRLLLQVLVRIRLSGAPSEIFGETRNVSAGGIYFVTRSSHFESGQDLECMLILPEKLTMAPAPIPVTAHGRVLRVRKEPSDEQFGVALEVSGYDFSRNTQTSSYAIGF